MTEITEMATAEQQLEAAAKSVGVKLQAFYDGLTDEEQRALDIAVRRTGVSEGDTEEDVTGYFSAAFLPLIVVAIPERVRQQAGSTSQPAQQR